jgi:excisionase family DNA binding protein
LNYLPAPEVAKRLGVHRHTLRRWISDGRLPAVRLSANIVRVPADALDEFVRSRLVGTATNAR